MNEKISFAQLYSDLKTIEKILGENAHEEHLLTSLKTAQNLILSFELMNIANNTNI
jgi:hypothetical protein